MWLDGLDCEEQMRPEHPSGGADPIAIEVVVGYPLDEAGPCERDEQA